MKKVLSVLLCAVMILSCIPFAVFAADEVTELTAEVLSESGYSLTGEHAGKYQISAGNTITILKDTTLFVGAGSQLDIYGTLKAEGIVNANGGLIYVKCRYNNVTSSWEKGTVIRPENIWDTAAGEHHVFAEVVFNGLPAAYVDDAHYVNYAVWANSKNGNAYEDINITAWNNIWGDLKVSRGNVTATGEDAVIIRTVPLNQYLYFRMNLVGEGGEEKYDSVRALKFKYNTVDVTCDQGTYRVFIENAGVVDFSGDKTWQGDDKYLKRERIYLPSGTGYRIYGVNGEASENDQTVSLLYGREFTFRLDLDKAYSESDYKVYAINSYTFDSKRYESTLAELAGSSANWNDDQLRVVEFKDGDTASGFYRDEYGVYHISSEYMTRECNIFVSGVVSNKTISLAGSIVEMLKNIFATIKAFFEQLFGFMGSVKG